MGDVQMSILLSFLCTVLPNVRSKHSSGSSIDYMGASVKNSKSGPPLGINLTFSSQPNSFHLINCFSEVMKEAFAYFFDIYNFINCFPNR